MGESAFVQLIRPPIERDDYSLLSRVAAYINEALLGGVCTRGSLARAVLDGFPNSRLAELVAEKIEKTGEGHG
jgi:hypothetical protein